LVISSTDFEDIICGISSGAIYGTNLSTVRIDNVNLRNIGGGYGVSASGGVIEITDSSLDSGGIFSNGVYSNRISRTAVKNISSGTGITIIGNAVIENVVVENIMNGSGMSLDSAYANGTIRVSHSTIKNVKNPNGSYNIYGLELSGTGNAVISNTTIEDIQVGNNSAIYAYMNGDLAIIDSTISAITSSHGLYLSGLGNAVISNTTINNVNVGSGGDAIGVYNRNLIIADTTIDNITAMYGVYGLSLSGVKIDGLALRDITGSGIYFNNCNVDIEVNNVDLQNISNSGIYVNNGNSKREFSNITGYNIRGDINMYVNSGSNITLNGSSFDTVGRIYFWSNGASINISDTTTKNVSAANALYIAGENIVMERVNVENVPNGRGIYMNTTGTGRITDSSIKNCTGSFDGGGINMGGPGNVTISSTTIEDVASTYGGGIYTFSGMTGNLTISDSTIKNAKAAGGGGGIYHSGSGNLTISNTTIEDVETIGEGGGIYVGTGASQVNISNTIIRNAKAFHGGGIYANTNGGSVTISETTMYNIVAVYHGSGIYIYNTTLQTRLNNVFNGILLNTQAAIANLVNNNMIYIDGSSQVVVLP
jgi:hypothetical protein